MVRPTELSVGISNFVNRLLDAGDSQLKPRRSKTRHYSARGLKWCAICDERIVDGLCPVCDADSTKIGIGRPARATGATLSRTLPAPNFIEQAEARAAAKNIRIDEAMSQIAREQPELHAAYVTAAHEHAGAGHEIRRLRSERDGLKRLAAR